MTLPKELLKKIELGAEAHMKEVCEANPAGFTVASYVNSDVLADAFERGAEALYQILCDEGDEFPQKSFEEWWRSAPVLMKPTLIECAQWAHSQAMAKVSALRAELAELEAEFQEASTSVNQLCEESASLKAQLQMTNSNWPHEKGLHKEIERLKGIEKDHVDDWRRIQDAERKCEALEAENARLREALDESLGRAALAKKGE